MLLPTPSTATMYLAMVILSVASAVVGYLIYWMIEKRATMTFRVKTS
nr:hypothetical protein [Erwinia rhapontici]